jgi:BMFP domain-containing protein YqiC
MKKTMLRPEEIAAERRAQLSRRTFLRGLGACLALPAFESFRPLTLSAAAAPAAAKAVSGAPLRMAFVYVPNGMIQHTWWPTGEGSSYQLAETLKPLEGLKGQMQMLGGLDHLNATAGPDGAGDHARASGTFLTGVRVRKTAGSDIKAGPSIDQLVAQKVGHLTRFPSLELTSDKVRKSGNCDSGYSCAYQYNLAWKGDATPVAPEPNPRLVFERLFGSGAPGERAQNFARRQQQQRSVLDFVLSDARDLQSKMSARDRDKLDEYLTSVREIEKRIELAEKFDGQTPDPDMETPAGIPASYAEHIDLMFDMMVLAFRTDSTRISTFLMASEGSNRPFPEIGISEGHHNLTHHQNNRDMIEKVAQIDRWYVERLARFLQKMHDTEDVDGKSLLHNSMIVYGSGNCDGNKHSHDNLPLVLAGGGGGRITPGRFAKFGGQPMSNLLLTMADLMGADGIERLGDSTDRLKGV